MKITEKINFKQPKYMLPAILYIPVLATGYFVIDMFYTEVGERQDKNLVTTEYLNSNLPDAKLKKKDIGSKYDSMLGSWGKIDDHSAVDNIDRDNIDQKEEYESKYTEEDLAMMAENERLKALQTANEEAESAKKDNSSLDKDKAIEELNRALAQARLQGQASVKAQVGEEPKGLDADAPKAPDNKTTGKKSSKKDKDDDDEDVEVAKKVQTNSSYFNTISAIDPEPNLIKAIIDEDVKATDGTRVRLRLLDEIEVGEVVVPKGTYLYVTMSGFGSQRVKGQVKSVLVNGDITKVNLNIYDMDGLEGLYVPDSQFRETAKDVGSGALSSNGMSNTNTSTGGGLSQWGMQAVQNAYTKTSSAISKAIKKNTVKLKYGTFVYLVNSKSKNNK